MRLNDEDTQWYKNVLKNPSIRINPRGAEAEVKVVPSIEATQISTVIEKFLHKYGASDMRTYHSTVDVAVVAAIRCGTDGEQKANMLRFCLWSSERAQLR